MTLSDGISTTLAVVLGGFTGTVLGNVIWDSFKPGRFRIPNDTRSQLVESERRMEPNRVLRPFGKPSGKRTPKANDDYAGWRKENEKDLV